MNISPSVHPSYVTESIDDTIMASIRSLAGPARNFDAKVVRCPTSGNSIAFQPPGSGSNLNPHAIALRQTRAAIVRLATRSSRTIHRAYNECQYGFTHRPTCRHISALAAASLSSPRLLAVASSPWCPRRTAPLFHEALANATPIEKAQLITIARTN